MKINYNFLNVCPFDCTGVGWGSRKVGPVNELTTSRVVVVNSTSRHKSVRNRCVIEHCCYVAFLKFPLV